MRVAAPLRSYKALNNCLLLKTGRSFFARGLGADTTAEDVLEVIGVTPEKVDPVLLNAVSVDFGCRLRDGDRAGIHSVSKAFDTGPEMRVRDRPSRELRAAIDAHLSKSATCLRIPGLDASTVKDCAAGEASTLLNEDRKLLRHTRHACACAATRRGRREICREGSHYRSIGHSV